MQWDAGRRLPHGRSALAFFQVQKGPIIAVTSIEQSERDGPAALLSPATEEFMAVAAHDVRNPIAVIRASAQMATRQLGRGDLDAARTRLQAIVDQTDRVTEILELFLDAARVGADRMMLRPERIELRDVIMEAVARVRVTVGDRASRPLDVQVSDGCLGVWDRSRIVRAVRVLIENAYAYGDPEAPVRVYAERDADTVVVLVSGGGPGPTVDESEHLFKRFFRGHQAAESGHPGSGLGLYTARGIARAHGGDVRRSLRSDADDTFEIELPLSD